MTEERDVRKLAALKKAEAPTLAALVRARESKVARLEQRTYGKCESRGTPHVTQRAGGCATPSARGRSSTSAKWRSCD